MKALRVASDLTLPLDFVTQTSAIVAKRRAGKSYTARRIAEQLFKASQQVVIVDPKGDWWGIRSAADGKSPGLPIVILGGERADVPLEAGAGEVVAKLVVEEQPSVLLDLSLFRKHEVATFMTAFLEALYRLKAREQFRTPLMLMLDEADAIAPQRPMKGEERMLGAAEDIVRRGGQRGIGCTLITQRTAVLNKNVLTQAQVLVALRTIAPQDLDAMNAWIDVHGTDDERRTLMESLPSLPVGDAWFWSPGWPTVDGVFERVHVLPIETFDSGATPKPGEKRVVPKHLADVDLDALRTQMALTIERAKENDPKELKKQIADLKRQIAAKPTTAPAVDQKAIQRVVAIAVRERDEKIRALASRLKKAASIADTLDAMRSRLYEACDITNVSLTTTSNNPAGAAAAVLEEKVPTPGRSHGGREARTTAADSNGDLGKGERAILAVLAQYPNGKNRRALGTLSGYSSSGGSFGTYLSRLRGKGYIEGSDVIRINAAGLQALGDFEPLPRGEDLQRYWLGRLGKGEAAILRILLEHYPETLDREDLGRLAGYEASGGSFGTYLSRLRTRELVDERELRASEAFFE